MSDSDDGDAYNTADARIHFGPVRSPEKKFEPVIARRQTQTPPGPDRGRGDSVGASEHADGSDESDEEHESPETRPATPEHELNQDEPSSVLASRIISAHDNPSPPPSLLGSHRRLSHRSSLLSRCSPDRPLFDGLRPTDDSFPESVTVRINTPSIPEQRLSRDSPLFTEDEDEPMSLPRPELHKRIPGDRDESGSSTLEDIHTATQPLTGSNPVDIQMENLVAPQPRHPAVLRSVSPSEPMAEPAHTHVAEVTRSRSKSPALLNNQSDVAPETPLRRSSRPRRSTTPFGESDTSPRRTPPRRKSPAPATSPKPIDAEDSPHTPVRRSSRPRRSVTPFGSPTPESEQLPPVPPLPAEFKPPDERGKSSPVKLDEDASPRRRRSRSRSPDKRADALFRSNFRPSEQELEDRGLGRQLGSLSPGTTNVLGQLKDVLPSFRASPSREPAPVLKFGSKDMPSIEGKFSQSPTRVPRSPGPRATSHMDNAFPPPDPSPKRITVQEAVARGQISPVKGARLMSDKSAATAQSAPKLAVVNPSPTRVPNPALSPHKPGSKVRAHINGQTQRGTAFSTVGSSGKVRQARPDESGPSSSRVSSSASTTRPPTNHTQKLPYPLVPSVGSIGSDAPGEQSNNSKPSPDTLLSTVPSKSTLRQPTSKIPRINKKPYSRLPVKSSTRREDTTSSKTKDVTGSSADLRHPNIGNPSHKDKNDSLVDNDMKSKASSPLKRKRDGNIPQSKAAPARQPESSSTKTTQLIHRSSPVPPEADVRLKSEVLVRPTHKDDTDGSADGISSSKEPSTILDPEVENRPDQALSSHETTDPITDGLSTSGVRRTGRVRKQVQPVSLDSLCGQSNNRPPAQNRRRPMVQSNFFHDSDPFASMSAVALRSMTSVNTTKNQHYLAAKLQTKVVRKQGNRPESPPMKVKTIVQKEKEQSGQRRKERAERRSRRSSESEWESLDNEEPPSSPVSYNTHRRGAGDDDDYETPIRPPPTKRRRLGEGGEENLVNEKRVTWDKGLYTTIFLDDVKPGTKERPKDKVTKKGCLLSTKVTLGLDTLGNLSDNSRPPPKLTEEQVVVKKFVYDNDPAEELPSPVVKNTRSKNNRKSKG